jgi:hypothetical protein
VADLRGLVLPALLLDVAEPRQRRGDRALVTVLAATGERLGDLRVGLVVLAEHQQALADIVERARDAALITGGAEQLEAAVQVLERELEIALAPPHPAHLVERDGRLGLARGDPRQAEHALERAERRLEVTDQLVDRAEVVPEVDARGEVGVADAGEGAIEQPDRALVGELRTRGLRGAAVPARGLARFATEGEVPSDLFLRRRATALGVQLEPARDRLMQHALPRLLDALVDHRPQVRRREPQLALARDRRQRRTRVSHSRSTSLVERRGDRDSPRVVAARRDLRERRAIGIREDRAAVSGWRARARGRGPRRASEVSPIVGRHLDARGGRTGVHHREPRGDELRRTTARQLGLGELARQIEAPASAPPRTMHVALEQQPHQLVERARRTAEACGRADDQLRHRATVAERLAEQLAEQLVGSSGAAQRAPGRCLTRGDVALAEAAGGSINDACAWSCR